MEQTVKISNGKIVCREMGGRVELYMEVHVQQQGLYKGFIRGQQGRMELGTLMPERNGLSLRRSLPLDTLHRMGCWPITGGEAVMTYSFDRGSLPNGWRKQETPETLFPKDPVLRQAAAALGGCLFREREVGFVLAVPFSKRKPFPLTPIFCFCKLEPINGQHYALFRFRDGGIPEMPGE